MLEEVHEMTARIEKLSQAEHDLIRDVHPQVSEIKEQVENVREAFHPKRTDLCRFAGMGHAGVRHRLREPRLIPAL